MCSETTANFGLPHYLPNDHPDFLTEINRAYETIDTYLYEVTTDIAMLKSSLEGLTDRIKNIERAVGEEKQNE